MSILSALQPAAFGLISKLTQSHRGAASSTLLAACHRLRRILSSATCQGLDRSRHTGPIPVPALALLCLPYLFSLMSLIFCVVEEVSKSYTEWTRSLVGGFFRFFVTPQPAMLR